MSLTNGILNLDDVIDKFAENIYERNERKDLEKALGCKLPWSELHKVIDTKELLVRTTVPNYENSRKAETSTEDEPGDDPNTTKVLSTNQILQPRSSNSCVFETVYTNGCKHEIVNSITTTRSTRATCSCRVTRGFVLNQEFGIKLALPQDILEFNAGFSAEMSVERESEKTVETEMTWNINTEVRVPGCRPDGRPTRVSAKVVIEEREFHARFYAVTHISGRVKVRVFRKGDTHQLLPIVINSLQRLFTKELGFVHHQNGRSVSYAVAGETHARFGVSQAVEILPVAE